jgi:polyisoprenoid-binding protein YceI
LFGTAGILITKVGLHASSTIRRSVFGITTFTSIRSGTLTIRTLTSSRAVQMTASP